MSVGVGLINAAWRKGAYPVETRSRVKVDNDKHIYGGTDKRTRECKEGRLGSVKALRKAECGELID